MDSPSIYHWSISHYLDDFFAVFSPETDIDSESQIFDNVLNQMGFSKAADKDAQRTTVIHLGFEIDSLAMEVRLSKNKLTRALNAITTLTAAKSVTHAQVDELLGFLSHCCQVMPIGRAFLRISFSLHRKTQKRHKQSRTRIPNKVKKDLHWWNILLDQWSSLSIAVRKREVFEVWTDASGKKGIGGWFKPHLFATRVPARHHNKLIDWKEMYAVLHAFVFWHEI